MGGSKLGCRTRSCDTLLHRFRSSFFALIIRFLEIRLFKICCLLFSVQWPLRRGTAVISFKKV